MTCILIVNIGEGLKVSSQPRSSRSAPTGSTRDIDLSRRLPLTNVVIRITKEITRLTSFLFSLFLSLRRDKERKSRRRDRHEAINHWLCTSTIPIQEIKNQKERKTKEKKRDFTFFRGQIMNASCRAAFMKINRKPVFGSTLTFHSKSRQSNEIKGRAVRRPDRCPAPWSYHPNPSDFNLSFILF